KLVAERLTSISRVGDTVARIGGDEFVVLQIGIRHKDEASLLANRIVRALSTPFTIGDREVSIGVTVGIALAPMDGVSLDRLATSADAALYQAKQKKDGAASHLLVNSLPASRLPPPNIRSNMQRDETTDMSTALGDVCRGNECEFGNA